MRDTKKSDDAYKKEHCFWHSAPPLQGRIEPKDVDYEEQEAKLEIKERLGKDGVHWTAAVKLMGGSVEAHKRYLKMMKDAC
ncbi:uncharacterized protein BKCO1_36000108 [Diplodia corticola]|uniref:Uncharacterized protein n=1 Tax=Diplodia corticola TaxID=236234 RepID=A0A1J9QXU1_9PEZI|nr:uncharacterized protein BKCO1_36000108 [Diplodia corticola]OJD32810.1 hypothetical protein BKCO1_36000108 [Diplodia corticola]